MSRPLLRPTVRVIIVSSLVLVGFAAAPGAALAQPPPETIEYYATDALGSVRVVFTPTGEVIGRSGYLPFGDTFDQSGMLPRQRFTGQERDGVAGLDDFNARSLQMRTGRMNRPDPLFGNAPVNPQRWNAYSYVTSNPLGFVDPSGMDMVVFKVEIVGHYKESFLIDELRVGGVFWGIGGDLPGPGSTEWPEPDGPGGGTDSGQPPPPPGRPPAPSSPPPERTWSDVGRCAARFSDRYSAAALVEGATRGRLKADNVWIDALFGSDAATLSDFLTGPGRVGALGSNGLSGAPVAAAKLVGNLPNPAATGLATLGTATLRETAGGTVYAATWTDSTIATSVFGKAVGRGFAVVTGIKLAWDVGTYLLGAAACGGGPK